MVKSRSGVQVGAFMGATKSGVRLGAGLRNWRSLSQDTTIQASTLMRATATSMTRAKTRADMGVLLGCVCIARLLCVPAWGIEPQRSPSSGGGRPCGWGSGGGLDLHQRLVGRHARLAQRLDLGPRLDDGLV